MNAISNKKRVDCKVEEEVNRLSKSLLLKEEIKTITPNYKLLNLEVAPKLVVVVDLDQRLQTEFLGKKQVVKEEIELRKTSIRLFTITLIQMHLEVLFG